MSYWPAGSAWSATTTESAKPPAPARPRLAPVELFGRRFPRALPFERGFWSVLLLGFVTVLLLAAVVLDPDSRGIGTHEQLGLPECGFVQMFGGPCPSCGFTTTFTLAAHLRPIDALVNQPFGFFLFCLSVLGAVALPVVIVKNVSLMSMTDRWPWWRIGLGLLSGWLICWGYKWWEMGLM